MPIGYPQLSCGNIRSLRSSSPNSIRFNLYELSLTKQNQATRGGKEFEALEVSPFILLTTLLFLS